MSSPELKSEMVRRQLSNCWSLRGLILSPLRYYNQFVYWKRRGLDTSLWPDESFMQTIRVARMQKNLAELCLELYQKSKFRKFRRSIVGFHYNGQPAVLVNDPEVIQRILGVDSENFDMLWQPNSQMNPILSKCPMFSTNLDWMRRDIWTTERLTLAVNQLLTPNIITLYRYSSLLLINGSHEVDLRKMCCVFAQQVFIRVGLGMTTLMDQDVNDGIAIFQTFVEAFESKTTEDSLYLLASNLASSDETIVPPQAEHEIRRLAERILSNNIPATRDCFLHWLNDVGLEFDDIVDHLYAFCFDLYIHLVYLGSFALHELGTADNIQNRLRNDLNRIENNPNGPWQATTILGSLLLKKFLKETKRKCPVIGCIARICKAPMTVRVSPTSDRSIKLLPGDLVFASAIGVLGDHGTVDLTCANPNAPILNAALMTLIVTNLRTNRLGPGNQDIQDVEINYQAILPETAKLLSSFRTLRC